MVKEDLQLQLAQLATALDELTAEVSSRLLCLLLIPDNSG